MLLSGSIHSSTGLRIPLEGDKAGCGLLGSAEATRELFSFAQPRRVRRGEPGALGRPARQGSKRQAADKVDEGATAAKDAGLDATASTLLCHGQVWATIIAASDQEDAEAIIVGSRGLSSVKSARLDSVANGVVHHRTRPVVVIPAAV